MTIDAEAIRFHATEVIDERLERTRGRLHDLTTDELNAVAQTADAIGQGVARCLLEAAAADASFAAVLEKLYPVGDGSARG
jgi:hypothetical protein